MVKNTNNKVALIGAGKIAGRFDNKESGPITSHAAAVNHLHNTELVGIYDNDRAAGCAFGELWQVPAFESISTLLEQGRPDIVSICTPVQSHIELAHEVIETRTPKVLIIEKPLCRYRQEFYGLKQAAERHGCVVVVNYSRRFSPKHQQLAAFLKPLPYGRVCGIHGVYYGGWRANATHLIDIIHSLCDDQFLPSHLLRYLESERIDDPLLAVDGVIGSDKAHVELRFVEEKYFQLFELELLYERGRVRLHDFANRFDLEKVYSNRWSERELCLDTKFQHSCEASMMLELYKEVVAHISDATPVRGEAFFDQRTLNSIWKGVDLYDQSR